jgi:hypothetical protein
MHAGDVMVLGANTPTEMAVTDCHACQTVARRAAADAVEREA